MKRARPAPLPPEATAQAATLARALRKPGLQPFRHALEFALIEVARESGVWFSDPGIARALYLAVAKIDAHKQKTRPIKSAPLARMMMDIEVALVKWQRGDVRDAYAHLAKFLPDDLRQMHDAVMAYHTTTPAEVETKTPAEVEPSAPTQPGAVVDLQCWRESRPRPIKRTLFAAQDEAT
jgi:hypothetical protein